MRRFLQTASVALLAGLGAPAAASAQDFTNIVTFGDSLSDPGNLGGFAPPPPYFGGRFSNGITWAEILASDLALPDVNVAFGGARADSDVAFPPGVPDQFPLTMGAISPTSLVTIWAGANDLFQGLPFAPDLAAIQALAIETATDQVTNVATAYALGGRTMLVPNLPNFGAAPGFNTNPLTAQGGTAATATFNAALNQGLQSITNLPGINIIQMDVNAAFAKILANPGAFGFTNVTDACVSSAVDGVPCALAPAAVQNQFLFWDDVHPTAAGHILLAQLANAYLTFDEAAQQSAALAEVAFNLKHKGATEIFDRVDSWLVSSYARRNGPWAELSGTFGSQDGGVNRPGYDYDFYGFRAGFDANINRSLIGISAALLYGDISQTAMNSDAFSLQLDLYASRFFGPFYLTGQVGGSRFHVTEQNRSVGVGPVQAESTPQGYQLGAAGEAGFLFSFGSFSLIPAARLSYVYGEIDSYDEFGGIVNLDYDAHEVSGLYGGVRLRAVAQFGLSASAFFEVGYEDFLSYNNSAFGVSLLNNTALPSVVSVGDQSATGLYFKVGADGSITDTISINAQYGLALREGNGETHSGKVRVKIKM